MAAVSTGCAATTNTAVSEISRVRPREHAFLGASGLVFLASAAGTIYWCGSMSGGMPMPGGWTMSMAWMQMPGQSWAGAAACFLGMWVVMMVAMMMPSLTFMLAHYRRSLSLEANPLGGLTAVAGVAYFCVWAIFGLAVYPLGIAMAAAEMRWPALARSVPLATGIVLLIAGCVQLSAWKRRQLGCCVEAPGAGTSADYRGAWQHGVRLGVHCTLCTSSFMLILLVTGAMDVGAMTIIAVAMTFERLAPRPEIAVRASGVVILVVGAVVSAQALRALA